MAEGDGDKRVFEQQLERAVTVRLQHFKDQADSLTLESVRRLLEKDLGLEEFSLDAHKRFIRHYLEKIMDGADESNFNPTAANMDKDVVSSKEEEKVLLKQQEAKIDPKKASTGNEETMEDSPIMGVLTPKSEVDTQSSLSESTIKKAILERADHFQANSDKMSLAGVRRLLEEDLGLDRNSLDDFKKFISQQVDEVLSGAKSAKDVKKKASEAVKSRKSKKVNSEEDSDASQSGSDEMRDIVKSKKEAAPRRNIKKLEKPKKRKISENDDIDVSHKKHNKIVKTQKEEDNNSDEDGSLSEDVQSQSSVERSSSLKNEKSAPGYGKKVEKLKSIIKACGMSVPPNIYKKVKQSPDDKRETILVKELEGILSREGLSNNPTEKEIKDCRKRKDRAKELEGIDMSNIISSSRRRSTFSFAAPFKPVVHAQKDKVDAKDSKKEENNEDNKEEEKEKEKEKEEDKKEEEEEEEDDGVDEEDDDEDESEEEFSEGDNEESD